MEEVERTGKSVNKILCLNPLQNVHNWIFFVFKLFINLFTSNKDQNREKAWPIGNKSSVINARIFQGKPRMK